jgi:putative tryptophan/tyrosine transport system substrate-binding protein
MMDRRRFLLTSLAGVLAGPRAAGAQRGARSHAVGLLTLNPRSSGSAATILDSLRQGFKEIGYREGENLVLEARFAEGNRDLLPALAQELLNLQSAVIVTFGTPATVAARNATTTVPIVFIGVGDPVGSGFASRLARPGGNLTGFSFVGPELAAKNLEFLKQAAPEASKVAVFIPGEPDQPLVRAVWGELEQAARVLHVTLQRFQILGKVEHLDDALGALRARRPDALLTLNDPLFLIHRARILATAGRLRLPTMFQSKEYAADGGLLAFLPSYLDQGRRAARYVDMILRGAHAADLPIEQPTKFELIINLKTAKALGLTIPPSLLLRADQVIE